MSLFSYFIFIFIFRFFFTAHSVIYSPCFISKIFTSRLKLTVGGLFESGLLPKVGKKGYQQAHTLLHFGVCNWKHQLSPQRGYIYIIEDYSSVCLSRSELNNPATNRLPSRPPTQLRPPSSDLSHHILASVDPRTKKTPAVPNPVSNYYTKKKKTLGSRPDSIVPLYLLTSRWQTNLLLHETCWSHLCFHWHDLRTISLTIAIRHHYLHLNQRPIIYICT